MTNEEAKFVLRAYRPNGRDAIDPQMAEALAQAAKDPALGQWFAREQAHDRAVAAKLAAITPPAGLREAILAGSRASQPLVSAAPARVWWRRPAWVTVAAAIAILLGVAAWWRLPVGGASLEDFALNTVAHGFRLQKHSADVGELKSWLADRRGPLPETLPGEFAQLRALGCRTLDYRGRDVSLVCFERDGREYHVFVARRGDLPGELAPAAARFRQQGKLVAAAWSDAQRHYVVVSDAEMPALRKLL